jgi:hypothetical protein
MTWFVQPSLINDPFSDPGLFIVRPARSELSPLPPRQLLRVMANAQSARASASHRPQAIMGVGDPLM